MVWPNRKKLRKKRKIDEKRGVEPEDDGSEMARVLGWPWKNGRHQERGREGAKAEV
jgi:hypothetical protein